ncbi:MAG: ComEC/Rec2 family competence protein, partial [Paracoccaceae bacterium]
NRLRSQMGAAMRAQMPSQAGAFAAGAMTGDRSGINQQTVQALRDSNLAHLLAISGMNMVFLIGFTFGLIRYGLALIPLVALRIDSRKLAAVISLAVAWFYLLLSGANVATERAFIMVAVMLGAILLDRRALTLRSVAIAAVIILLWQPESLAEPGFQMSFAATVALIAGFAALDRAVMREHVSRWVIPVFTLVLSSVLAGFATAPYAAAHFNRFTDYGLLANLLTVPMMSVIMAMGAVAALLAPLGLEAIPLWVMEQASRWILYVAHWVAGLDGAVTPIVTPGPLVIPLVTFGALWVILWRGKLRFAGAGLVVGAFVLWGMAERPALLISSDGALAGLVGAEGRAVSAPSGAGFSAENWLQNDGDLAEQSDAAARPGFSGPKGARTFKLAEVAGVILTGKQAAGQIAEACARFEVVVVAAEADEPTMGDCLLIDRRFLAQSGALALHIDGDQIHLTPARSAARIWTGEEALIPETTVALKSRLLAAGQ